MSELVLTFMVAGRRAALRAPDVHSVVELEAVTPVPGAPPQVRGLTALRSAALAVIDCTVALGLPGDTSDPRGRRAAVVEDGGFLYALLVDDVEDVCESQADPVPVPGDAGPGWERVAAGMIETARGPALLVDPRAFFAPDCIARAA